MQNTLKKLTTSQPLPPTTMLQLATYMDKTAFDKGLARLEQSLSIRKSIETAPLIAGQGEKKMVVKEIIRIIEFFLTITGKNLDEFQVIVLAGDLYEKFRTDTLEDIILMFKMARMGDFGKVYTLDNFLIMDWANTYLAQKSEERERMLKRQKRPAESPEQPPRDEKYYHELSPEFREAFDKTLERWRQAGPENDFLPPKATFMMTIEKWKKELGID